MEMTDDPILDEERHDTLRIRHLAEVCTTELYFRLQEYDHGQVLLDFTTFHDLEMEVVEDNMPLFIAEIADILGRENPMDVAYDTEEIWSQTIDQNWLDLYEAIRGHIPDQLEVLFGGTRRVIVAAHPTRGLRLKKMDRLWPTT